VSQFTLPRKFNYKYPIIKKAEGIYLFDQDNKKYIDGCSGAFVSNFGHNNQKLINSFKDNFDKAFYVNGKFFHSELYEQYCFELNSIIAKPFRHSLLSSGSDAMEAALKFVFQYHRSKRNMNKSIIFSRSPSYHGNTLWALAVSGRKSYQKEFQNFLPSGIEFVKTPYEKEFKGDYQKDGSDYYLNEINKKIEKLGADNIAAIIVEPISGSSIGGQTPPDGYLPELRKICTEHDILLLFDEVLTGFGRVGNYFAFQNYNVYPDLFIAGKGLTSGLVPCGMLSVSENCYQAVAESCGGLGHQQTFMQNSMVAAAGLAVIKELKNQNIIEAIKENQDFVHDLLNNLLINSKNIGSLTGIGALWGLELFSDPKTLERFSATQEFAYKVQKQCLAKGLAIWAQVGGLSRDCGDQLIIAPPLNTSRGEYEQMSQILQGVLDSP